MMLIVTSCAFLVFNIPVDVFFIGYSYGTFSANTPEDLDVKKQFYTAVTILSYTNNSINFFMYFVSGRKFRSAFVSMFSVCRRSRPGDTTALSNIHRHAGNTRPALPIHVK